MRSILPALLLWLVFVVPTGAEARGRNSDSIYTTAYPRCGTYGCGARHDREARVGRRDRGVRESSFRSSGGSYGRSSYGGGGRRSRY